MKYARELFDRIVQQAESEIARHRESIQCHRDAILDLEGKIESATAALDYVERYRPEIDEPPVTAVAETSGLRSLVVDFINSRSEFYGRELVEAVTEAQPDAVYASIRTALHRQAKEGAIVRIGNDKYRRLDVGATVAGTKAARNGHAAPLFKTVGRPHAECIVLALGSTVQPAKKTEIVDFINANAWLAFHTEESTAKSVGRALSKGAGKRWLSDAEGRWSLTDDGRSQFTRLTNEYQALLASTNVPADIWAAADRTVAGPL